MTKLSTIETHIQYGDTVYDVLSRAGMAVNAAMVMDTLDMHPATPGAVLQATLNLVGNDGPRVRAYLIGSPTKIC